VIKFYHGYFMRYYLFFTGRMEYAIISFSVGDKILPWLFHAYCVFRHAPKSLTLLNLSFIGSNDYGVLPLFSHCKPYSPSIKNRNIFNSSYNPNIYPIHLIDWIKNTNFATSFQGASTWIFCFRIVGFLLGFFCRD
jgi:hypothetical protein